jgi:phosphinothricin acetyltransferase
MILREAAAADGPKLAALYGHHVLQGLGTFEETPPSGEQMADRLASVQGLGLPYVVAEGEGGDLLGFAYAGPFRTRAAYRYTVEDSVYVAPGRVGQGVGTVLLRDVIARCEAMDLRQMIAVIGDSANAASIALHASLGFEPLATLPALGFKHGRWVDVVWMQRALNAGRLAPPRSVGLAFR